VAPCRPRLFLTHGEKRSRTALADLIQKTHQIVPATPGLGDVIDLAPAAS
jgi:predicted metal-dependent RNase